MSKIEEYQDFVAMMDFHEVADQHAAATLARKAAEESRIEGDFGQQAHFEECAEAHEEAAQNL